jgi:phage terminase Nu1 subunit (DNA packaging protein)
MLPPKVSTADLATLLGVTERAVTKLVAKKILHREQRGSFDLVDSVQAFIAHREAVVAAQHGTGTYGRARAQLYLERARLARLKREELEGTLGRIDEFFTATVAVNSAIRNRLLAVPSKAAPRLVNLKTAQEAQAIVRGEIYEALETLSQAEIRWSRKKDDNT